MCRPTTRRLAVLVAIIATIGCDQATKQLAERHLAGRLPRAYLFDTVRLEYAQNAGAFLGWGSEWPANIRVLLFTVGAGALLVTMAVVVSRRSWSLLQLVALSAIWAGGVSNVVDRVLSGRVTDFLNVGIGSLRTGIFNVGDVGITLGVVVLPLCGAVQQRETIDSRR